MFSSTLSDTRPNVGGNRPTTSGSGKTSGLDTSSRPVSSIAATSASATLPQRQASSAVSGNHSTATSFNDLDYASQQKIMRAINILGNSGLLMKYALENDISIPQARHYFEQVAGGGNPEPMIKKWFPF